MVSIISAERNKLRYARGLSRSTNTFIPGDAENGNLGGAGADLLTIGRHVCASLNSPHSVAVKVSEPDDSSHDSLSLVNVKP